MTDVNALRQLLAENNTTLLSQLDGKVEEKIAPLRTHMESVDRRQDVFAEELRNLTKRIEINNIKSNITWIFLGLPSFSNPGGQPATEEHT